MFDKSFWNPKAMAQKMLDQYGREAIDRAAGNAGITKGSSRNFWNAVVAEIAELKPSCMPIHWHVIRYLEGY